MQSTPLGSTIYRKIQALDKDAGVNGLVEYFIVKGDTNTTEDDKLTSADGYGTFAISFPHQGQVSRVPTYWIKYYISIKYYILYILYIYISYLS